jgi:hypothetical protein
MLVASTEQLDEMEVAKACLIAFLFGIFSHHAYFIHGEHLTNIPILVLLGASTWVLGTLILGRGLAASIVSAGLTVSQLYAAFFAGLWLSILVYRAFFHRLHSVPGPFGARLSKFYHIYAIGRRLDQYRWLDNLHHKYGPIVRIGEFRCTSQFAHDTYLQAGPSSVSICDPEALEDVHGARSKCVKPAVYDISLPFTTLQQMRDKSVHERRRRTGGWDEAFSAKGRPKV